MGQRAPYLCSRHKKMDHAYPECVAEARLAAAVKDVPPGLPPVAAEAARNLAEITAFDYASLAMVLSGLVLDSTLEVAEIPEPGRPDPAPDNVAAGWLLPWFSAEGRS